MKIYSFFLRDGSFSKRVSGPFKYVIAPTLAAWDGFHYEGEYDGSYYFFDGEPVKRPENTTTLVKNKLKKVPKNSVIHIDGESYECKDGGTVSLDFPMPGTYEVTVESWPYLDAEFTYENNA